MLAGTGMQAQRMLAVQWELCFSRLWCVGGKVKATEVSYGTCKCAACYWWWHHCIYVLVGNGPCYCLNSC
jgi:hypothetical protein